MTNIPYIRMWTYQDSNLEDTLRRACSIATTLNVGVRYQMGKERFLIQPGTNADEFLAAYNQAITTES